MSTPHRPLSVSKDLLPRDAPSVTALSIRKNHYLVTFLPFPSRLGFAPWGRRRPRRAFGCVRVLTGVLGLVLYVAIQLSGLRRCRLKSSDLGIFQFATPAASHRIVFALVWLMFDTSLGPFVITAVSKLNLFALVWLCSILCTESFGWLGADSFGCFCPLNRGLAWVWVRGLGGGSLWVAFCCSDSIFWFGSLFPSLFSFLFLFLLFTGVGAPFMFLLLFCLVFGAYFVLSLVFLPRVLPVFSASRWCFLCVLRAGWEAVSLLPSCCGGFLGDPSLVTWSPSDTKTTRSYSAISPTEDKNDEIGRQNGERDDIELSVIGSSNYSQRDLDILLENMKVSQAMSKTFLKISTINKILEELLWTI
ncbi:hypothetical protein ACS0TY_027484 [Phlomoides rotata]